MSAILFVCHRIPFPPDKGDKIATYNILKWLSGRFDVHLACFIDAKEDLAYQDKVAEYCASSAFFDISQRPYWRSGIRALLTQKPVSIAHYHSPDCHQWIAETVASNTIERAFCYSSSMGQFLDVAGLSDALKVVDMADIDSDKWRQYAEAKKGLSALIYKREYQLLAKYEQYLLAKMDRIGFVSAEESTLFSSLSPTAHQNKVMTIPNGVDTDYFNPEAQFDYTDKPAENQPYIAFVGAMDYWANVDAVVWFVESVWPLFKSQFPDFQFYIVGGKPTEAVTALSSVDGVVVTGRVVDVRPFVEGAACCVASLRIARGVQNKVLEAMAMSKAVVMTHMAQEGIQLPECQIPYVTDDATAFFHALQALVTSPTTAEECGVANRKWVEQYYSWEGALQVLDCLLPKADESASAGVSQGDNS